MGDLKKLQAFAAKELEKADVVEVDNVSLSDEQTTEANLKRLTEIHLHRYRGMLRRAMVGDPGLRIGELKHLVAIWEGVELKGYRWNFLAPEERNEVYDAVMSDE